MGCIITEAIGIPIPHQISWGGRIPMWYRKSNGVLEFQWSHWNSKDGPYCHSEKRCNTANMAKIVPSHGLSRQGLVLYYTHCWFVSFTDNCRPSLPQSINTVQGYPTVLLVHQNLSCHPAAPRPCTLHSEDKNLIKTCSTGSSFS